MSKKYYAVALQQHEAMLRSMDVYRVCRDIGSHKSVFGSDDDPSMYVLFDTEEQRDGAFHAFRGLSMSARAVYSPFNVEEDDPNDAV